MRHYNAARAGFSSAPDADDDGIIVWRCRAATLLFVRWPHCRSAPASKVVARRLRPDNGCDGTRVASLDPGVRGHRVPDCFARSSWELVTPRSGMDAKFGCRRHFMPQARGRHRPVAATRRAKWMEIARQDQARQLVVEACASHFTLTSFEACLNAFRSMRPYSRSCFARVAFAVVAALLCVGQHDRRPRNHDHRRCRAAARTRRRGRHMTSWLPHTTALTIRRYAGLPPGGGRGAK